MSYRAALLVAVILAGCATSSGPSKPPTKPVAQYYQEAFDRHFAPADKWRNVLSEFNKCLELAKTNLASVRPCLDQLPAPETFIPKDRIGDETYFEYAERKMDEWEEKSCFYKGLMEARYLGEAKRIEDQCKRDLEIKRLRKEVEKLNKQRQR